MPDIASTTLLLAGAAQTANPVFQDLQPVMYFILGVLFAVLFFSLIVGGVQMLISHLHKPN